MIVVTAYFTAYGDRSEIEARKNFIKKNARYLTRNIGKAFGFNDSGVVFITHHISGRDSELNSLPAPITFIVQGSPTERRPFPSALELCNTLREKCVDAESTRFALCLINTDSKRPSDRSSINIPD